MEAALEGDDLIGAIAVQRAVFARELDRAFVGFGSGIGEEHLIETAVRDQGVRKLEARRVVEGRTGDSNRFACAASASAMTGGAWPRQLTAQPCTKSR